MHNRLIGPIKCQANFFDQGFAQLIAQHTAAHFLSFTFRNFIKLERTVGHPNKSVHHKAEMLKNEFDLAVFTLA